MTSFRQILYQIVFGTKEHKLTIDENNSEELYKYIWGIIKNNNCKLYRINGIENHVHILTDFHPSVALADLVKDVKVASNIWMKEKGRFPNFEGWQDGYSAFTYSLREKEMLVNYIKNQKEHHKKESFEEEYRRLLKENGIKFDERYLD